MSNPFTNVELVEMTINGSSLINNIYWRSSGINENGDNVGDLVLSFVKGGSYKYVKVPSSILNEMLISNSIGSYFHENIRDNYKTIKGDS